MRKIFLFIALVLFAYSNVYANLGVTTTKFTYSYNARKALGQGTVYAATSDIFNPSRVETLTNQAGSYSVTHRDDQTHTKIDRYIYLDALPAEGYGFLQWRKVDSFSENNTTISVLGNTRKLNTVETINTSGSVFYYEADFAPTMVSVSSETPDKCQVFIDKEINEIGETVTLTATTEANYKITWKKKVGNTVTTVSTNNPLVVPVTEQAHYLASATLNNTTLSGYYRLRSANPDPEYNHDYVRLADNFFDMHALVASKPSNNPNNYLGGIPGVQVNAPFYVNETCKVLKRDLKLSNDVNKVFSDPSSIVYIKKGSSDNEYYLYAQGTHVKEMTTGVYHGSIDISYQGTNVYIVKASDVYSIYAPIKMQMSLGIATFTVDFGKFYFTNANHEFTVHYADDNCNAKWFFEKIDANSEDKFYSADFSNAINANDKYYTTLRLPFNCQIPQGSKVKAYSVTQYPASGDLTTLATMGTTYSEGQTIPAGIPVVLESSSNNPADNKLMPTDDPSSYISSAKTNSDGVTTGITTALYNEYGRHKHDAQGDQPTTGDGVGYFSVAYSGSAKIYKLGVNDDGVVGFWDEATTLKGNEAYATQPCALFPKEVLLKDLPETVDQITYKVTNPLTVAYVDAENSTIYAKDEDGTVTQAPTGNEIDFMDIHYPEGNYGNGNYSNWIAIKVATLSENVRKGVKLKNVTGKVVDDINNRTIECKTVEVDGTGNFTPKTYSIANFSGSPQYVNTTPFFFATPKPNEVCEIVWAQYDDQGEGNTYFIVPQTSAGFEGSVNADFTICEQNPAPQPNAVYKFLGLVRKNAGQKAASNMYTVYPLEQMNSMGDTSVPTGISNVNTGNVVNVKYYNVMGVESSVPFNGVNIVVTTYDNGTRSISKILR